MALYWGLDSWTATNLTAASKTFYDRVVDTLTPADQKKTNDLRRPYFWGRYIGGPSSIGPTERDFLHAKGVGVLLIFNGLTKAGVKGVEAQGRADAEKAIGLAGGVVPSGRIKVWIYANIDVGFEPSVAWLKGWMKAMFHSQFGGVGGLYCNTYDGLFNRRLGEALQGMATEENRLASVIRDDCKLYIQNPLGGSGVDVARKDPVIKFNPKQCPNHPSGAAIWQASIDRYKQGFNLGGVDINVANENGYDGIYWP